MRTLTILLLTLGAWNLCNGQTQEIQLNAVQIITPQTFYLNGGLRATFGGKSRTSFYLKLPPNTVEWYYSFTTSRNENDNNSIDLVSQLTNLIDPTGLTSLATSSILTPTGAGVCDIYLMDRANSDAFLQKVDNNGETYYYNVQGSRQNGKDGTVEIDDITDDGLYLGFKNPSASEGINITFEAVAIVQKVVIIEKSQDEQRAELFGNLAWKAYEKGEYEKAMQLNAKALEINKNMGWVHNNIGLIQLLTNDYISAIESYSTAITQFKNSKNPSYFFSMAIKDLNALISMHGNVEGAQDILELLKME